MAVYSDELKAKVTENLVHDSYYNTAIKFGLHSRSKNKAYLRNLVKSFFVEVRENPDKFGIVPELFETIQQNMDKRIQIARKESTNRKRDRKKPTVPIRTDAEVKAIRAAEKEVPGEYKAEDLSIDRKAIKLRDTMTRILDRRLRLLEEANDKELKQVDLVRLTTAFGTLVDKAQLLQGNATEHVALYARVNNVESMSADEAMGHLLKAREVAIESKKNK